MFRKDNTEKMSAQKLVILAFFVALYIVLERFFSFNVWNMRVGFAFIALALAGMLYGPLAAGLVGAVGDILGMLLFPTGPYFPGFTIINTTAATQTAIPVAILAVSVSPNISVPIMIAVSGSNTPRTAVFVGPI